MACHSHTYASNEYKYKSVCNRYFVTKCNNAPSADTLAPLYQLARSVMVAGPNGLHVPATPHTLSPDGCKRLSFPFDGRTPMRPHSVWIESSLSSAVIIWVLCYDYYYYYWLLPSHYDCTTVRTVHTLYCAVYGMRCLFIVIIWTWITPKSVAAKCHIQNAPGSAFWFIFNSYKYWWHVAEGKHTSTSRMQNLIKSGLAQRWSDTREPETSANCECLCRAVYLNSLAVIRLALGCVPVTLYILVVGVVRKAVWYIVH